MYSQQEIKSIQMIYAKNEDNKNIDWWFIYKTPEHTGSHDNEGYQYLYYDEQKAKLSLSEHSLDQKSGALFHSLDMVFNSNDPDQGYIVYNDERTDGGADQGTKGHTKGVLTFNKKTNEAMILLHSTPRFPAKGECTLPDEEKIYGQTYLCVTLESYDVISEMAAMMLQQQNPQVLVDNSYLPDSIGADEALSQLYHQQNIKESDTPGHISFLSKEGKEFRMIAKSKKWGKDFWIDLVSPELGVDLNVESWRRGAVTESEDDTVSKEEVEDVMQMDLSGLGLPAYAWKYTKDHSKWGVVADADLSKGAWVCVADINRMKSQEKRGGGVICFIDENLRNALNSTEAKLQIEP